eukprot:1614021-Rhodomonas_salina.7
MWFRGASEPCMRPCAAGARTPSSAPPRSARAGLRQPRSDCTAATPSLIATSSLRLPATSRARRLPLRGCCPSRESEGKSCAHGTT